MKIFLIMIMMLIGILFSGCGADIEEFSTIKITKIGQSSRTSFHYKIELSTIEYAHALCYIKYWDKKYYFGIGRNTEIVLYKYDSSDDRDANSIFF